MIKIVSDPCVKYPLLFSYLLKLELSILRYNIFKSRFLSVALRYLRKILSFYSLQVVGTVYFAGK